MARRGLLAELSPHLVPVMDLRFGNPHAELWRSIRALAAGPGLGGVLIRGGTVEEWHATVRALDTLGKRRPLVFADFEQGAASQIRHLDWLPTQFAVGATGDPADAAFLGRAIARQARQFGVDVVLGPVADLFSDPTNPVTGTRCFGATPKRVADNVSSFIHACQREGIGAVAKHFPGHGGTAVDSHYSMPEITVTKETWIVSDLRPFEAAIRAHVSGIMVGHLWASCLDPDFKRPATLSDVVLRDILRRELGFGGYILTDSFEMKGIPNGDLEAARRAIEAGADFVVGPRAPELASGARPENELPMDHLKDVDDCAPSDEDTMSRKLEIARRGTAWIGPRHILGTTAGDADITIVHAAPQEKDVARIRTFLDEVKKRIPDIRVLHGLSHQIGRLDRRTAVVVLVSRWEREMGLARLLDLIARIAICSETIVVLLGALQTVISLKPGVSAILCGDATRSSQIAAAEALFGDVEAVGVPDLPSPGETTRPRMGGEA